MSVQGPLRRWKRFLPAFGHIDTAIEAAHPSISRDEFRSVRGRIVEMLCDAQDAADDERAEQLCLALDGAMAESLVTLLEVPVSSRALASGDLAKSVSTLGQHESARIRSLTRHVMRRWRLAVRSQLDSAKAAMVALNNLTPLMPPEMPVAIGRDKTQIKDTFSSKRTPIATGKGEMQSKDTPAKFLSKRTPVAGSSSSEPDKMLATKRKVREGYQEAENSKSQRKIRVIEEDKMLEQPRQKKMRPITPRETSRVVGA